MELAATDFGSIHNYSDVSYFSKSEN